MKNFSLFTLAALFPFQLNAYSFKDIPKNHFIEPALEELIHNSIIDNNTTFRPNQPINRAEFLKMVLKTKSPNLTFNTTPFTQFTDVPENQWYSHIIASAFDQKIIKGYPDKTFRPNNTINRAEAAMIIYRAFPKIQKNNQSHHQTAFKDIASNSWYSKPVTSLHSNNIIKGKTPTIFAPNTPLTRAESAIIMHRLLTDHIPNQQQNSITEKPHTVALWVWHDDMMYDKNKTQEFIKWAQEQNVETLFFNAYPFIETTDPIPSQQLANFIKETPFKYELLIGEHEWTYSKNHTEVTEFITKAANFIETNNLQNKINTIHLDVEADTLPEWHTNETEISIQYLNLIKKSQETANKFELALNVDIPNWYEHAQETEFNGQKKPLYEHIIDTVDQVTIMNYIDIATGDEGMIELAKNEIKYANITGKKVLIGAETNQLPGQNAAKYTFYEEGHTALKGALNQAHEAFKDDPSYAGLVIHDYIGLKQMTAN